MKKIKQTIVASVLLLLCMIQLQGSTANADQNRTVYIPQRSPESAMHRHNISSATCAKHLFLSIIQGISSLAFFSTSAHFFTGPWMKLYEDEFLYILLDEKPKKLSLLTAELCMYLKKNKLRKLDSIDKLQLSYPLLGGVLSGASGLLLGWKSIKNLGRFVRDVYLLIGNEISS